MQTIKADARRTPHGERRQTSGKMCSAALSPRSPQLLSWPPPCQVPAAARCMLSTAHGNTAAFSAVHLARRPCGASQTRPCGTGTCAPHGPQLRAILSNPACGPGDRPSLSARWQVSAQQRHSRNSSPSVSCQPSTCCSRWGYQAAICGGRSGSQVCQRQQLRSRRGSRCNSRRTDSQAPADTLMLFGDAVMLLSTEFVRPLMIPSVLECRVPVQCAVCRAPVARVAILRR